MRSTRAREYGCGRSISPVFLNELSRYPWIAIAFSVRESYEEVIVPEKLIPDKLIRAPHDGFEGFESAAVTHFFAHYEIATPAVPLLQPEFSNPLFLVLFCEGVRKCGLHEVPAGLEGLTAIFDFFLESVNQKLSGLAFLDYDPATQLVQRAVSSIAKRMGEAGESWLPYDEASDLLGEIWPAGSYQKSLLRHLLSEGLLSKDRFYKSAAWTEGIRFAYERFTDHQIAAWLLDTHLDPLDPTSAFALEQPLGALLGDESSGWKTGLLSALAIQLPERVGRELPGLAPHIKGFRHVQEAMIESFLWRKHDAFADETLAYLNENLLCYESTRDEVFRVFLSVSTQQAHPYNAELLHRNLARWPMPERDASWSIFLHYHFSDEVGPIVRILNWCEHPEARSRIADESLILLGIVVAWFLTSSNRFLRDRATKALVLIFTRRLRVLTQLLERFKDVDDLYVLERLLAAAYGCSMRTSDKDDLAQVAMWCYRHFFEGGSPPPHILIRDYARGVIERALYLGAQMGIDPGRIKPPYGSKWSMRIPPESELKALGDYENKQIHPAQLSLYGSVMHGDFAWYIIGTNSGIFEWSTDRIGSPRRPTPKERREQFLASLSEAQLLLWEKAEHARFQADAVSSWLLMNDPKKPVPRRLTRKLERDSRLAEASFVGSLNLKQRRDSKAGVLNAYRNPNQNSFDLKILQRFIVKRVFELGWTAERFGDFDRWVNYNNDRRARKAERMGKKYQWLAYHEVLARVSDNFAFMGRWRETSSPYMGPWQISGRRDIDPSITIRTTQRRRLSSDPGPCWWAPLEYPVDSWRAAEEDQTWFETYNDIPRIQRHLHVIDPADGSRWLALEGNYTWEEPTPEDRERYEFSTRMIWYILKSYIVRKEDFRRIFRWAMHQDFMGRWDARIARHALRLPR